MFLNRTNLKVNFLLPTFFFFVFLSSPALAFAQELPEREVVVMAMNDVYRIEGVERGQQGDMSLVRALRQQMEQQTPDFLILHVGDFCFYRSFQNGHKAPIWSVIANRVVAFLRRRFPGMSSLDCPR